MRIAVYAGTFDPITLGHLSVVERGARLFDHLYVVVAINPEKVPIFSLQERVWMISEATRFWPNVTGTSTDGYVVDFAQQVGADVLLRGVRGATDAAAEVALAAMNHGLAPTIETVFVPAHPSLSEVSSSKLKELAALDGDIARYCPPFIARRLREKLQPCRTSEGS